MGHPQGVAGLEGMRPAPCPWIRSRNVPTIPKRTDWDVACSCASGGGTGSLGTFVRIRECRSGLSSRACPHPIGAEPRTHPRRERRAGPRPDLVARERGSGTTLLVGDLVLPSTVGLRRLFQRLLGGGSHAEAILLRDVPEPRLHRHGSHRQRGTSTSDSRPRAPRASRSSDSSAWRARSRFTPNTSSTDGSSNRASKR